MTYSVAPVDDPKLSNLLLHMCLESWQNQYDLMQETVPQDLRKLLTVLENIEKCEQSSNVPKWLMGSRTEILKKMGSARV